MHCNACANQNPKEPFIGALRDGRINDASELLMNHPEIGVDVQRVVMSAGSVYLPDILRSLYAATGASGRATVIRAH